MLRLDANLSYLFTELEWDRRFDAAATAGFVAVEINAPAPYQYSAAEFGRRLADAGLSCVGLLAPVGEGRESMGMAIFSERRDALRSSVERALEYCEVSGTKLLHVLAGRIPGEMSRDLALSTYVEHIAWAADQAARIGVTLGIEPVCRVRFDDYLVRTTEDAVRLMKLIARNNVGLIYDFYHAQMEEGQLSRTLVTHVDKMAHIQIGNPPGRHEPDNGELDFNYLFNLIERLGYSGWLGCEYVPTHDTISGLAWARRWGLVSRR